MSDLPYTTTTHKMDFDQFRQLVKLAEQFSASLPAVDPLGEMSEKKSKRTVADAIDGAAFDLEGIAEAIKEHGTAVERAACTIADAMAGFTIPSAKG